MVALALAGIAAPVSFTILVVVQGWLQPDYNHVRLPISALAVWPAGWIQNINFYAFGALMTAYAVGLHRGIRPTRRGVVGIAILVLSGIGLVLAGLFPMVRDGTGAIREPAGHVVAAFMAFLGAGIGLIVISRRMAVDPAWRHLAGYALACGITIVVLFPVMGALAVPDEGPLHPWFGLLQRVVLLVWFPCTIVLARRLLRLARVTRPRVLGPGLKLQGSAKSTS